MKNTLLYTPDSGFPLDILGPRYEVRSTGRNDGSCKVALIGTDWDSDEGWTEVNHGDTLVLDDDDTLHIHHGAPYLNGRVTDNSRGPSTVTIMLRDGSREARARMPMDDYARVVTGEGRVPAIVDGLDPAASPTIHDRILAAPMRENDADAGTVGDYLAKLASMCWEYEDGFGGKRPFGNSGWKHEIYDALVHAGIMQGVIEDDGLVGTLDRDERDRIDVLVTEAARQLARR